MKQRGSLLLYGALAAGVVIAGLTLTTTLYRNALKNCRTEYASFVAQTKAIGETAQKAADQEKTRLQKAKETADDNAKRLTLELNATRKRLRDARASRDLVSAAPQASRSPEKACFDRTELRGALQRFEAGIVSLLGEGDSAITDLNIAKGWIKDAIPDGD